MGGPGGTCRIQVPGIPGTPRGRSGVPDRRVPRGGTARARPARRQAGPVFAHDTPYGRKSAGYAYGPAMIFRMAAIAGKRRRASTGGVHVLLQGRVDPAIKERADRGAAARGVSIARYLEILIENDEVADTYVEPGPCEQLDLGMSA